MPHREWLLAFDRIVNDVKAELATQGRADEFVGCKIIYTTLRFVTADELVWYLEDCLALKQEFPHLIAGQLRALFSVAVYMDPDAMHD